MSYIWTSWHLKQEQLLLIKQCNISTEIFHNYKYVGNEMNCHNYDCAMGICKWNSALLIVHKFGFKLYVNEIIGVTAVQLMVAIKFKIIWKFFYSIHTVYHFSLILGPQHIISNPNSNGGSPHHAHFKENLGRLKVYQTNSDAAARGEWRRPGLNGHHTPSNIGISKYR